MYYLNHLEFNITLNCNLKCKGCSHMTNVGGLSDETLSIDTIRTDLQRLKELDYFIKRIAIIGGEPLLVPNVDEYCRVIRDIYPDTRITIFTNGILIPSVPENIWKSLQEIQNVELKVTAYTILDKEKIATILNKRGISYRFSHTNKEVFRKSFKCIADAGPQVIERFKFECKCRCPTLHRGYLSHCPMEMFLYRLEALDAPHDILAARKVLNIHRASGQEIDIFLNTPSKLCAYCDQQEMFTWCLKETAELSDYFSGSRSENET